MKLICVHGVDGDEVIYYLRPDTALLRNNAPFYYPDFTAQLVAHVCVVIRVCRLGRSIGSRFAARYYDAVGAGVTFTAADLLARDVAGGKPWGRAVSFDYSAAVSREFVGMDKWRESRYDMRACSEGEIPLALENIQAVDKIIGYVSNFMTLKIGDYIFIPAASPFQVTAGHHIETFFMDKKMLEVAIK
ncbi:MAG: 2-hydroxyhepta-2,4-diene-1,7-dioate isomerase [Prevotellaceae bacterium]|nr:2-hydroxyhepta-2,4-diene-1,7-dioate isomerase [Prevotellaceae bacterium]